jgi:hypothetical protein
MKLTVIRSVLVSGAHPGGLLPHKNPKTEIKKETDFVDIISKVLRYFPFSRNQPLGSADN